MSAARPVVRALMQELAFQHKVAQTAQIAQKVRKQKARDLLEARASPGGPKPAAEPEFTAVTFDSAKYESAFADQAAASDRTVSEITEFLKHQRTYKELLERYNGKPYDTQERVRLTARRVGLDTELLD